MFAPSRQHSFSSKNKSRDSFSSSRVSKQSSKKRDSFRGRAPSHYAKAAHLDSGPGTPTSPTLNSPIWTIMIGPTQRLFASHEHVLIKSPTLLRLAQDPYANAQKRISLPNEDPEVFSSVLEFLYKDDYTPNLVFDNKYQRWSLVYPSSISDAQSVSTGRNRNSGFSGSSMSTYATTTNTHTTASSSAVESVVFHSAHGGPVLKDTAIYCAGEAYALPELKRLALKKQCLQSGVKTSTILSSARFAYANTPDSDSRLRAHYLALIVKGRARFRNSSTMRNEMVRGGACFFDLFVAMCDHVDHLQG